MCFGSDRDARSACCRRRRGRTRGRNDRGTSQSSTGDGSPRAAATTTSSRATGSSRSSRSASWSDRRAPARVQAPPRSAGCATPPAAVDAKGACRIAPPTGAEPPGYGRQRQSRCAPRRQEGALADHNAFCRERSSRSAGGDGTALARLPVPGPRDTEVARCATCLRCWAAGDVRGAVRDGVG